MKDFLPIVKLACLTAAAALIVSCGGGADYRNVLPADSFVTMSVDAASLLKKSGTCDAASNPLLDRLKTELDKAEELSAEEKEYLFSLLENPAESGLDLKKELFLFMSADGADINNPEVGGGLLFPVGDKSKLDALIARINEKSGTETVTEAGVSVVKIGEESEASGVCAYNDIACLLYFKTDPCGVVEEKVRKLFAQKRAESLMGDKAVAARLAARNDVNMVVSYANLSAMMNNPMLGAMPMMDVLKGALVMGSANFEKGRIVSDAAVSYKDKASVEKAAAFYAYVKPQTGDLLRYVPAGSLAALSYGLDGEKLYAMLAAMPGYGMMLGNPMVKQVLDAFDGDCVISFSGMTPDGRFPIASLLAQVNDPAVLQTVVTNLAGMPVQQTAEGEYVFNSGDVSVLFGVKNKVLYCTTDTAVKSALDGAKIESLMSLDGIVKGQSCTFWVDFKGLSALVSQLAGEAGTPQTEAALAVLGMFDDMEAYSTMEGGKLVVNMADKEQNAFKTICDTTGALIRQYMPEADEI